MCTINEDHMIYGSWNTRCNRQKFFCHFGPFFCPFSPLTTWKIKILKLKKTPGDIIILHICTINDSHMMYGSWDMECNGHNFLSFWTVFFPLTTLKIKILKKWKNTWRYYHFTNVYHKWQSYDVWFLRYGVQRTQFFVILDCVFPLNNLKNQNFEKMKKHLEILSFYKCVP